MGLLDRLKRKSDKLEDWKVKAAEKEAFRTETARRKEEAFNRRIAKAQARGKAKAMPFSERLSSAASDVGKFIQSESFQKAARAGAGFGNAPRKSRRTTTRKATKKHTKKAAKRRSSGRRQPDFSSMLLGY